MNMIVDHGGLVEVLSKIDAHGRFAMDLEFIPERTYYPVLCLVQIATDQETFIIDPLKIKDLSELWKRVADPSIKKVLHAPDQDLDLIYKISAQIPQNIFDTQIAAGFAGFGYPAGYGKLLHQMLGITIAKTESFSDWLERPLSSAQLAYAREDVCHLLAMADRLAAILTERGRLTWVLEECSHYSESEQYQRERKQQFSRVKGASALNRRALAILQRLCELRDIEAQRIDRPTRSVLSDTTLIELSRRQPQNISDIERIRGVRTDQVRSMGKRLLIEIETAMALPLDDCPSWPSGHATSKGDTLVGDMLYTILKIIAYQADIATELIATRDDVQELVRLAKENKVRESKAPLLIGWRNEMAGQLLCRLTKKETVHMHLDLEADPPVKFDFENQSLSLHPKP